MKEIALDYNNCAFSPRVTRLIEEIRRHRHAMESSRLASEKKCGVYERERQCRSNSTSVCENSSVVPADTSADNVCGSSPSFPLSMTFIRQFQGLGCHTNRSLNFFIVDSDQYPNFLVKLGYSSKQIRQNSNTAFIIDPMVSNFCIFQLVPQLNVY